MRPVCYPIEMRRVLRSIRRCARESRGADRPQIKDADVSVPTARIASEMSRPEILPLLEMSRQSVQHAI